MNKYLIKFRKLITSFLLAVLFVVGYFVFFDKDTKTAEATWWNDSWLYRKAITINHTKVAGDLTNFPMLVSVTDTSLGAHAQEDGDDIIFVTNTGEKLSHEIESFATTTGALVAWVKMPILSSTQDETIYMYYGNYSIGNQQDADNVWDENFKGVWHLDEGDSTAANFYEDSTANANHGQLTDADGDTAQDNGKIGKAIDFNGDADYIDCGNDESLDMGTEDMTMSAWIRVDNTPSDHMGIVTKGATASYPGGEGYMMGYYHNNSDLICWINDGVSRTFLETNNAVDLTGSQWFYVAVAVDRDNRAFFRIDGVEHSTDSQLAAWDTGQDISNASKSVLIGHWFNTYYFNGAIDEVRISGVRRSDNWLKTEYNNQSNPATFFAVQAEEVGTAPVGYWSFDEGYGTTAHDSSSGGNNGTISGATWQDESMCMSGKCLYFDGTDDYVNLGQPEVLNYTPSIDEFSISAWIKIASSSTGTIIGKRGDTHSTRQLNMFVHTDNKLEGYFGASGSSSGQVVADNIWHHVMAVNYDDSGVNKFKFYVDGVQRGSPTISGSNTNSLDILIGARRNLNNTDLGYPFKGFIDEVKIYPSVRSADQVKQDYVNGKSGAGTKKGVAASFGGRSDSWLSDGLVGYWKMDEVATTSGAVDSSGNGNTGTYYNTASTTVGRFGRGGTFNGTSDVIKLSDDQKISGLSAVTLSVWIKKSSWPTVGGNFNEMIVGKSNLSDNREYRIRYDEAQNMVRWHVSSDGSNLGIAGIPTSAISLNKWQLLTGVWDNRTSKLEFYLNGELATSTVYTASSLFNGNANFSIAGHGDTNGLEWNYGGSIDEVRLYNRALSADEIRRLYEWAPGPVAHWKMDEKTGSALHDSSGYGYDIDFAAGSASPIWARGKYGSSLLFDGVNDYAESAIHNDYDYYEAGTVEFWFKTNTPNVRQTAVNYTNNSVDSGALMQWRFDYNGDSYLTQAWKATGTWSWLYGSTHITDSEWHHASFVADGVNQVKIYLDGKEENVTYYLEPGLNNPSLSSDWIADVQSVKTQNNATTVGARRRGTQIQDFFDGQIDDVRIYNYARTQKQVLEDMNAGNPAQKQELLYLKFDEGYGSIAHDSSGNGNDGTLEASSTGANTVVANMWDMNGKYGKAIEFDGTNDYISLDPNFSNLSQLTYSAWIYPESFGENNYGRILFQKNVANSSGPSFNVCNDEASGCTSALRFEYYWNAFVAWNTDDKTINLNEWNHVLVTFDNSSASNDPKMYINGKLVNSYQQTAETTGSPQLETGPLYIGNRENTSRTFDGNIDEVKIWNYILTEDEVKTEYNRGAAAIMGSLGGVQLLSNSQYCIPGDTATCDPAAFQLNLDELSGSTFYDMSGNNNNATLVGNISYGEPGVYNYGLGFDGSDSHLVVANESFFDFNTSPMSICFYMKSNHTDSNTRSVIHKYFDTNGSGYLIYLQNSKLTFFPYKGDGSIQSSTVSDNKYHYICATRNGTSAKLYIDGKIDVSGSITVYNSDNDVGMQIGKTYRVAAGWYDYLGVLDEVKIYNYERTPSQIAWEYKGGEISSNAASREYCVPGDVYLCTPPVLEYKMDEFEGSTLHDTSDNGYNSTFGAGSASPSWKWGKFGSALEFDGVNDYSYTTADIDYGSGNKITVSSWIKFNDCDGDSGECYIVSKNKFTSATPYTLLASVSGKIKFYVNSTSNILMGTKSYNDNKWHYAVGVLDSTSAYLYVDGILASSTIGLTPVSNNEYVTIGGDDSDNAYRPFKGFIDEVKIYDYARTPAQIAWEYNRGKPTAEWRLNDCVGDIIHDESGNANHGTLHLGTTGVTATGTCASSSNSFWYNGRSGKRGNSGDFDGLSDYITFGSGTNLLRNVEGGAVSAWIKPNLSVSDYQMIVDINTGINTNSRFEMLIGPSTNKIEVNGRSADSEFIVHASTTNEVLTTNIWQHVMGIINYKNDIIKIYVNGIPVESNSDAVFSLSRTSDTSPQNILVGRNGVDEWYFDGQIDEVKIWNYALTDEQVKMEYNGGAIRFGN